MVPHLALGRPPRQALVHVELARDGVEVLERLGRTRRVEHRHGEQRGRGRRRLPGGGGEGGQRRRRRDGPGGHPRRRRSGEDLREGEGDSVQGDNFGFAHPLHSGPV